MLSQLSDRMSILLYLIIGLIGILVLQIGFHEVYGIEYRILALTLAPNFAIALGFAITVLVGHKVWSWTTVDDKYTWTEEN